MWLPPRSIQYKLLWVGVVMIFVAKYNYQHHPMLSWILAILGAGFTILPYFGHEIENYEHRKKVESEEPEDVNKN